MKFKLSFPKFLDRFLYTDTHLKQEVQKSEYNILRDLSKLTGKSIRELEDYTCYYKMSVREMADYYLFFKRLPDPDYIAIIRHIGVDNLIKAVQSGHIENF
jgi:hypothetical protein